MTLFIYKFQKNRPRTATVQPKHTCGPHNIPCPHLLILLCLGKVRINLHLRQPLQHNLPRPLLVPFCPRHGLLHGGPVLAIGPVPPVQQARRPKVLIKRKVVKVVLQVRRQAGYVVARVGADGAKLEEQEREALLRPVVRHQQRAQRVGDQVGEDVLRDGAVRRRQPHGRRELVVLLVEARVQRLGVERAVDVVEADLCAQRVEYDGRKRLQRAGQRGRVDGPRAGDVGQRVGEREGDQELVPERNQTNPGVLPGRHAHKGLRLVLEQPSRPRREVGEGKDAAPRPEEDGGDEEGTPDVDGAGAVGGVEVGIETVRSWGGLPEREEGHDKPVDPFGAPGTPDDRSRGVRPALAVRDGVASEVLGDEAP